MKDIVPPGNLNADTCALRPQEPQSPSSIWVIIGSTGEYSDRYEWLTRAYSTEEAAKDYVALLMRERQKLGVRGSYGDSSRIEAAMQTFDPGYSEAYTGTSWHVEPVGLFGVADAGASPSPPSSEGASSREEP